MNTHTRTKSPLTPYIKPLLWGIATGVVAATVLLLLCALLVYKASLPAGAMTPLAVSAVALGAFAGGLAAGLSGRQSGLLMGAVCGTLLYLILLIAGLARGGGVAPGYAALKWAVMTVCSAAGGVLGVNRR
jgi:putative membrane protein (TIGR04086 family)